MAWPRCSISTITHRSGPKCGPGWRFMSLIPSSPCGWPSVGLVYLAFGALARTPPLGKWRRQHSHYRLRIGDSTDHPDTARLLLIHSPSCYPSPTHPSRSSTFNLDIRHLTTPVYTVINPHLPAYPPTSFTTTPPPLPLSLPTLRQVLTPNAPPLVYWWLTRSTAPGRAVSNCQCRVSLEIWRARGHDAAECSGELYCTVLCRRARWPVEEKQKKKMHDAILLSR